MNSIGIAMAFLLFVSAIVAESDLEHWQTFKSRHSKLYLNHVEETKRFSIFQSNLRDNEDHNAKYEAGEVTWYKAVNQFSDLTHDEFKAWLNHSYGNGTDLRTADIFEASEDANIPASFDWREKGAVTGVKNQGGCGGCWAFATIGAVEGAYFVESKKLESFSEQQVLDCSKTSQYGLGGCDGGWPNMGIQYIADYGIETESSYPFAGQDTQCRYNTSKVVTKVKGPVAITPRDENALKQALALNAPAAIAIDADFIFQYGGGVFNNEQCKNCDSCMNHAVLAVGYGSENGLDYWIIKNSWGEDFGERGYIRINRANNLCGVLLSPTLAGY